MVFPYPHYYPNQREMINFIKSAARTMKNPVLESPTGSGKTIAVLSALLPIARSQDKKIIYLCRTHEQMDRVLEELKNISNTLPVKGLSLRSRRDLCLNDFIKENTLTTGEERLACSILKKEGKCSFYKNLRKNSISLEKPLNSGELLRLCSSKKICPYEISKTLLDDCDVIACSYLYIFNPGIRKAFLNNLGKGLEDVILILDEAHNLPRLAIETAGERLTRYAVERAQKEIEDHNIPKSLPDSVELMEKLYRFITLHSTKETRLKKNSLTDYLDPSPRMLKELEEMGEKIRTTRIEDGKRPVSFLYNVASFLKYWIGAKEERFAFFSSISEKGAPYLEILSLEPKTITKEPLNEAYLSVHMSGTLTPIDPYCRIVGLDDYEKISFSSPFKEDQIIALIDPSVSTMGSERTPAMYKRIAERIGSSLKRIPGNVLVFFPSYKVLQSVLRIGINTDKTVFLEERSMSSSENNEMVQRFKKHSNAVLYGVQQGRNSEGQDFPGDQAEAVIVVGVPYAMKGPRIKAQIEYFQRIYQGSWGYLSKGEYYAYYLPAYRCLNQSAGRAHRKLSDRAAIIFLERRVAYDKKVKANISPWIKDNMKVSKELEKDLEAFYRGG